MTQLLGQRLGRYQIEEEIGRGGMARVYRALDTLLQRSVALKVLAPQLAVDPEFAQRFEREAITAANLRHPNIVTIYDVGEHNAMRYIAMEYVRGRSLHAIIEERGALGIKYAVSIVGAVGAALDYAHERGAVHRDVKPQNIMVDTEGRVLLTDFGIALAPDSNTSGERLTRTGVFMGTPEYISPEQASAQPVTGRSDLYSLGIAAYELLTGRVPFSGTTLQLIVAHAQQPPLPPSEIDPTLSGDVDLVIARILAKRPEDRYASGAAFTDALRRIAQTYTIAPAGTAQLAALAKPRQTSDGQDTVLLGRDQTVRGQAPLVAPPPEPAQRRVASDAPAINTVDSHDIYTQAQGTPQPFSVDEYPAIGNGQAAPQVAPADRGGRGGTRIPWLIAGPLLAGVLFFALFFLLRDTGAADPTLLPTASIVTATAEQATATPAPTETSTPTPTATAEPTATVPPTAAPTVAPQPVPPQPVPPQPTAEPVPATEEPTAEPTEEPVPPTAEPVPPTAEPVPPTNAPRPPATNTPVPATEEPTAEPTEEPVVPTEPPQDPVETPDSTQGITPEPEPTQPSEPGPPEGEPTTDTAEQNPPEPASPGDPKPTVETQSTGTPQDEQPAPTEDAGADDETQP